MGERSPSLTIYRPVTNYSAEHIADLHQWLFENKSLDPVKLDETFRPVNKLRGLIIQTAEVVFLHSKAGIPITPEGIEDLKTHLQTELADYYAPTGKTETLPAHVLPWRKGKKSRAFLSIAGSMDLQQERSIAKRAIEDRLGITDMDLPGQVWYNSDTITRVRLAEIENDRVGQSMLYDVRDSLQTETHGLPEVTEFGGFVVEVKN
ncbi:MAG: hypothetical protein ACHQT9_02230 [Candidatus Saccharimonadales bacterium]